MNLYINPNYRALNAIKRQYNIQTINKQLYPRSLMNNTLDESLMEFQVPINDNDDNQEPNGYRKRMCLYYLVCLILGEITWCLLSVGYYEQKIQINSLLIGAIIWVITWAAFGLKYKYMHMQQFLFWLQACFQTLMYILGKITQNYHFILCGSSTTLIFFFILELLLYKKVISSKFFLYLYLWYAIVFYDDMKKMQFSNTVNWASMLIMDIYWLMSSFFLFMIMKSFRYLSKHAKWQLLLLFYPWSLILVFCLAGTFPEKQFYFKWIYFTIINHGVFLFLISYIINNKQLLPKLRKFNGDNLQQNKKPKVYQISDVLLVNQQDYVQVYRQSMKGQPPLADCTLCYDQQSVFCYINCNHAAVGRNCIRSWLQKNVKKCPICRTQSNNMFEVERIEGILFAVNRKIRFKQ